MNRDHIVSTLRAHSSELRAAGVLHLRLFGSVARDEATTQSDVDLLVEFDPSMNMTLVSVGRLQRELSDLLGVEVDLSASEWMREPVRTTALAEAVLAF